MRKQISIVALTLMTCLSWGSTNVFAQDEEKSSRRESEIIKAIEKAGGRVYQISAADESREVSFALAGTPVTDEHLKNLSAVSEVVWLNLAGTEISNKGLKQIAGLKLTKLHLEKTKIGDGGLQHLKEMKDLTYLNLYDTQVTDAGLEHLAGLSKLRKLFVWKSKVTLEGMKKLNESLPELEIVGELKLVPVVIEEPKKEEKKEPAKKEPAKKEGKKPAESKDDAAKKKAEAKAKKKKRAEKKAAKEKADKKAAEEKTKK